jgi:hypothetical protein
MDPNLTWEERFRHLEAHRLEETEWLIQENKRLSALLGLDTIKIK